MILSFIRLAFFFLSQLGWWEFFRRKSGLQLPFLPILTIAGQFCVLFAGGLLNLLPESGIFIYLGGLLSVFVSLKKDAFRWLRHYRIWCFVFLAGWMAIMFLSLRNSVLVGFDDFAHWGIVVKKMLKTNRFPSFLDEVVGFQKYPLGTSAWLWFFCRFTNSQEDSMLMGQSFLLLCCVLPWFSCLDNKAKHAILCTILSSFSLYFCLCYNTPITTLMVDTLLPLAGMAAVFFVYYNYLQSTENSPPLWYAAVLLIWVAQIKNSGLLFALLASGLLLAFPVHRDSNMLLRKLFAAASPALGFLLWSRHCDLVFSDSGISKHAMSADNYALIFSDKSAEEVQQIITNVFGYIANRKEFLPLFLWLAILGLLVLYLYRQGIKRYLYFLGFFAFTALLYCIGICGMYLFSMPTYEALMLAAIERYMRTLDIALIYLLFLASLGLLGQVQKIIPAITCSTFVVVLVLFACLHSLGGFPNPFHPQDSSGRMSFETTLENYGVPENSSCFICVEDYKGYEWYYFLCRYYLDTTPYCVINIDSSGLESISGYNVLLNFDPENPILQEWIMEHYPDHINDTVIYMYY